MKLIDELTIADLEGDQKELAELVGLDAYKKMVAGYAGSFVYIPKEETLTTGVRNKRIVKEFNGANYSELAHRYNLTERYVRRILAKEHSYEQASFWD